jgi:Nucleotidyl transferase AbiEii toxin, Type IV TA system
MPISGIHREVAAIALTQAARYGFVLGGGNALIVHGVITRATSDVDLVTDRVPGVKPAAQAVEEALKKAGYTVQRRDQDPGGLGDVFEGFEDEHATWVVSRPPRSEAGEDETQKTFLEITHIDRDRQPVIIDVSSGGAAPLLIPVLDLKDAWASKACAAANRGEERDLVDLGAALEQYTVADLVALARQLDPGLDERDFEGIGYRLDTLPDRAFYRYGLGPDDVAQLRKRFRDWPRPSR